MKFYLLLTGLLFSCLFTMAQNASVSGVVTDELSGKVLPGMTVESGNIKALTDDAGHFVLNGLAKGVNVISISGEGYETFNVKVDASKGTTDLGKLSLKTNQNPTESGVAEITLTDEDNNAEQTVSGLLHSGSDPYVSASSYAFSPMFFKVRGYDQEYQSVYMNGIPVNDAETGRAVWNEWGGLNDVTRNKETSIGLEPANYSLGSLGGTTNLNIRPSMQRRQTKFSYSLANKSYNNRLMFTYSTGLLHDKWAFTVSGSRRWSQEGYVEGTSYHAYSWFAGVERKINQHHSIDLIAYASPYERALSGPATQETYDLAGNNFYNPNWGMQEGKIRNSRIRRANEPMIMANHFWTINSKTNLKTSLGYTFGQMGTTRLNWYNAQDPRPDYYRYLPSYETSPYAQQVIRSQWENDLNVSQVNWGRLYGVNYIANAVGDQAHYIIEDEITKQNQIYFTTNLHHTVNDHHNVSGGLEFSKFKGNHFKTISDLLGGKYWVDIDQFAERDFAADTVLLQNDLNNPNRVVKEGDKFGFDYVLNQTSGTLWALYELSYAHIDAYAGASVAYTSIFRDGNMRNGRNPDNSYGKSDILKFSGQNIKVGITYKVNGRHYVSLNAASLMTPPNLRDVYISPRNGADEATGNQMEMIASADLSYIVRYPNLSARVTVFNTAIYDHSDILRFYHDDLRTYVNMSLNGQNRLHRGIEAGVQTKITSWLSAALAGTLGDYRYTNRPTATVNYDNGTQPDTTYLVYLKDFFISGTPQSAWNFALKFNKNFWFVDLGVNYFDKNFLSINPMRRTESAITGLSEGHPLVDAITKQKMLEGGFTLDGSIGKSIRYKEHFVTLNLSVSNILNNTNLISGGFEQTRFDFTTQEVDKFPPKYFYSYGTTFFFNVGIRL